MKVRSVQVARGATLVEWIVEGQLRRGWLPSNLIDSDQNVAEGDLHKSVPYGLPLETILPRVVIEPDALAAALHSHRIWTSNDVVKNPNDIAHALLSCLGFHVAQVQTMVREFDSKRGEA